MKTKKFDFEPDHMIDPNKLVDIAIESSDIELLEQELSKILSIDKLYEKAISVGSAVELKYNKNTYGDKLQYETRITVYRKSGTTVFAQGTSNNVHQSLRLSIKEAVLLSD